MNQTAAQVLGVEGSPRRGSNSSHLLGQILDGVAQAGLSSEAVHLRQHNILACIGCERCRQENICQRFLDDMQGLYPKITGARGLVLVSPTHHYNITAWMKAFIDRLYCFYDFGEGRPRSYTSRLAGQGRAAVVAAVCEQPDIEEMGFTLQAMRLPLEALGYEVIGELAVTGHFDAGAVAGDAGALARARKLGSDLGDYLTSQ